MSYAFTPKPLIAPFLCPTAAAAAALEYEEAEVVEDEVGKSKQC